MNPIIKAIYSQDVVRLIRFDDSDNPGRTKAQEELEDIEREFEKMLSSNELAMFKQYKHKQNELIGFEGLDDFTQGFKVGAQLILEALT